MTSDPRLNALLLDAWHHMDSFDRFMERLAGHGIQPPNVPDGSIVGFYATLLPGEDLSNESILVWNIKPAELGLEPVQNPYEYFARHFPVQGTSEQINALYSYVEAAEDAIDDGAWEDSDGAPFDATATAARLEIDPPDLIHSWEISWKYGDPLDKPLLVWTAEERPSWLLPESPHLPSPDDGLSTPELLNLVRERGFQPPFDQENPSWHVSFTRGSRLVWDEPYEQPCRTG
ncbi:hypothetical protein Snas_2000 [Stackebrandtia nassauensis DSM 44728]|uniref:Uncharacterized protein n=1 Tax=Stackebrandtia nassauensis (strain DSM 44728 / CIP 108903 / NRRL B-16338 / NBRC 102104 / LLR-40K-21) TaxID=446470 RepID=D3Q0G0_STANL|nr:hypothetical protein Snas_2000 [Stackebrandtia nassauensis DSM 44728]